ncbi:uncharacterized protein LOC144158902 isoform X1 [Haemaphysalis longicornis]
MKRRNLLHASCTTLMTSMPDVATSLMAEVNFGVVLTDGIHKSAVSSSQGTQATIHRTTIATQCTLEFLTTAGCQTEEMFREIFPALRDSAVNTDEALAEQQGNHTSSGHAHSISTGTVADGHEKAQFQETLHQCGSSKICNSEDSALPTQKIVMKVSYMCRFCKKVIYRRNNLKSHIRTHTGEKPFVCKVCEKRFNRRTDLRNHESSHSGKKPFVCKLCQKGFANRKALTEHESRHRRERLFSCSTCQMSFTRKYTRDCHEVLHTGVKPYTCDVCKKGFFRKGNLTLHKKMHCDEKVFACEVCHKRFVSQNCVDKHKTSVHNDGKPLECSVCQKTFTKRYRLLHHERRHVQPDEKSHVCGVCQISFTRKSTLTRHEKRHSSKNVKDSTVPGTTK